MKRVLMLTLGVGLLAALVYHLSKPDAVDPELRREAMRAQYYASVAARPDFASPDREPCVNHRPERQALFGGLHVHTAYSTDAYAFDTRVSPDEAYRYARGGSVLLPPLNASGTGTRLLRSERPLDFMAVTDHAEYMGEGSLCLDPSQKAHSTLVCKVYRGDLTLPVSEIMQPLIRMLSFIIYGKERPTSVCGSDGSDCIERSGEVWQDIQRAAEDAYDRSSECKFTSFVGYEYSLAEKSSNLHRNVIFSTASVPPLPLSSKEAPEPSHLWQWLQDYCLDAGVGCDALAIPHNSNWSSGRMFFPEYPGANTLEEKRVAAALRKRLEPLAEVVQVKGDSECRRGLYGVTGTVDEQCDFEKLRPPSEVVEDCKDSKGEGGMMLKGCLSRFSYTRYGLIQGLAERDKLGINPFEYGLIAASDSHNGTGGDVDERKYEGAHGMDSTPEKRLIKEYDVPGGIATGSPLRYNPGGIAGVWAEENSREAIFAALKRRETFGTSGPRIVPRFFGGWEIADSLCSRDDLAQQGYAQGVPMGAVLPEKPTEARAPQFALSALRDSEGNLLQRLQVVKGVVLDDGRMEETVYDVAGHEPGAATVDIESCQPHGPGSASLCARWQDPDFDAGRAAVYYLRVLENPSCRWSSWQCLDVEGEKPAVCSDPDLVKTIQERAWTSPIWYYPASAG